MARRRGAVRIACGVLTGCLLVAGVAMADSSLGTSGGVAYWTDSQTVAAPGSGNLLVECPAGTKVTGGGFGQSALSGEANDSFPNGGTGWVVNVQFGGGGNPTLDAYAICAKGKQTTKDAQRMLKAGKTRRLTARCPSGKHLIGGGAAIYGAIADARLNSSYPIDGKDNGKRPDDGWRARGVNVSANDLVFQAFAVCAGKEPKYRTEKITLMPSTSSAAIPACPGSKRLLSGGVRLTGPGPEGVIHSLRPSDGTDADSVPDDRFLANGENEPGSAKAKRLTGYAICR